VWLLLRVACFPLCLWTAYLSCVRPGWVGDEEAGLG